MPVWLVQHLLLISIISIKIGVQNYKEITNFICNNNCTLGIKYGNEKGLENVC